MKSAVVYWSGTGNTEAMAQAVAEGMTAAGAEAVLLTPDQVQPGDLNTYGAIAFGCPAMGAEVLEEAEFEPMWNECEGSLSGVKIALFGSYGWGDGQWMRDWVDRCRADGADVVGDVISNEYPGDAEAEYCRALGAKVAA